MKIQRIQLYLREFILKHCTLVLNNFKGSANKRKIISPSKQSLLKGIHLLLNMQAQGAHKNCSLRKKLFPNRTVVVPSDYFLHFWSGERIESYSSSLANLPKSNLPNFTESQRVKKLKEITFTLCEFYIFFKKCEAGTSKC